MSERKQIPAVSKWVLCACVFGSSVMLAGAQAAPPVVRAVRNAASFAGPPYDAVAAGSIATIFGDNLAPTTMEADSVPLPTTLGGTSVKMRGLPVPLFYVSPTQINFQVPSALQGSGDGVVATPLVVSTQSGTSEAFSVTTAYDSAEGIFTMSSNGCGQGAVLNHTASGVSVNGPKDSAEPGGFISIYLTGLGQVYYPPTDGTAASSDPLSKTMTGRTTYIGLTDRTRFGTWQWSGRAPGLVGVDQLVIRLPEDAPQGCAVPLSAGATNSRSQPVTIAIRRGGGPCVDPPMGRAASLVLQRRQVSAPEQQLSVSTSFEGRFEEAPESLLTPGPAEIITPAGHCYCGKKMIAPGPSCPGTEPNTVSAGKLRLTPPAGADIAILPEGVLDHRIRYRALVPDEQISDGILRVAADGGEVGAFDAQVDVRAPIQITTVLKPGTVIPVAKPFRLTWTGGSADMLVRLRLMPPAFIGEYCECSQTADKGFMEIPTRTVSYGGVTTTEMPIVPSEDTRVEVTVTHVGGPVKFLAPGMTVDGTLTWRYDYEFKGVHVRR